MKRRRFVCGSIAAVTTLGVAPCGAASEFPGTLAVVAQRVRDDEPFAARNAHVQLPAASVIKLVILIGIAREIDDGSLRWSDTLAIRSREIVAASESFGSVAPGTRASVRALAYAMVTQSDNTAGNVFADHLGFARVNAVAASLSLRQTALRRHFMDFATRARGIDNTTSAADMATLLLGIERGAIDEHTSVASPTSCRAILGMMLRQEDRETIPDGIGRHVTIANKTGVLPDVRNDVAIVDPYGERAYVVAILSRFTPSAQARAYALLRDEAHAIDRLALHAG